MVHQKWQLSKGVRWLVLVLLIGSLVLAACDDDNGENESTPVPTEPAEVTLGLAVSNLSNPFFVSLRDGAQTAADRLGVQLLVEDAQDNPETQLEQIQSLIDQGVSALLINPVGGEDVVPAIEAANEAGIPVFTLDRSAAGGEIVSHVASDNFAGGEMAGDHLAERLGRQGKVVELQGIPGTSAAEARGAGFNEAIAAYPDIEVIVQQTANFDRAEGQEVFAAILEEQPEIDGVFAHNDEMILGALEAAREAERADDIVFIGFDAVEDAVTAVENGDLAATIAQQPAEMGRLGMEAAVDYLNGEEVAESIPVDLALIIQ
ncbi:MAG: D-ribose ABC transporter substrate-binding protein [Chloroflexi bacterium]|nr:D-ribose ABC transporter substrate-binding protein [Chloroflexota bacterium]